MAKLGNIFERVVQVEVGKLGASKALLLDGLHIDFNVKDGEGTDSTGEITVYNLSKETYNEIKSSDVLVLKAGHKTGNSAKVIFVGKIVSVIPTKQGADIAYLISCNGGTKARAKKISKTYSENINIEQMMRDLAKEMGMSVEISNAVIAKLGLSQKKYMGGVTVHGRASDELEEIARDFGLEMRIDDIKIRLIEKGKPAVDQALSLSLESGLIESMKPAEINEGKETVAGWSFKTILFPEIVRGSKMIITDPYRGSGTYRVVSRSHSGSNYGSDFYTTGDVLEVK